MMHLSNTELYYTPPENITGDLAIIDGDEFKHITRVMRHTAEDEIYLTNGEGKIFLTKILDIKKDKLAVKILHSYSYENRLKDIYFCIPKIKSTDRLEFALEKCVELGITKFIIYESKRSYKKGGKAERWNRIILAAMKQALLSFLPEVKIADSLSEIVKLPGEKIILEQNAENSFFDFKIENGIPYYIIFGPEGGLTSEEMDLISKSRQFKLTSNRLRTETAVISCAVIINTSEIK